jgi:hypothetical protein
VGYVTGYADASIRPSLLLAELRSSDRAGIQDGLLDGVDAQMQCANLARRLGSNRSLDVGQQSAAHP